MSRLLRPAPRLRVIGLDLSLSSTGFAYKEDNHPFTGRIATDKLRGLPRLYYIRQQLTGLLDHVQPQLAVIEDYTRGRNANNAFDLGELGGVVKTLVWERGIDIMLVSVSSLKKSIVGRGDADRGKRDKPEMRQAIYTKFGYELKQNDEADAFALMMLGELRCGGDIRSPGLIKQLRLESLHAYPYIAGRPQSLEQALQSIAKTRR